MWSWTSIDGPISYHNIHAKNGALYDADPFQHQLTLLGGYPKTGELIIEGKLVTAAVRMRQEYKEESGIRTIYELGDNVDAVDWVGMAADTHLKPYQGKSLHGEILPATQRLAPGEAMPYEGWASTIYCLLLGVGQSRCECLVLGLSARMLNAFERLGIIGSILPSVFASRAVNKFVLV
jgi:hypothetical protein